MAADPTEPDPASDPVFTELPEPLQQEVLEALAVSASERQDALERLCRRHPDYAGKIRKLIAPVIS